MPDLSRPLEECLQAVKDRRNLQDILRRYPQDREELVALLRLAVDLNSLGAPAADPAFRLRARNRMLAMASQRRAAQERGPFAWLPRPAARLALSGAFAVALILAGFTAAAASNNSLPGDALYGVKLGVERVEVAVTFNAGARARLQLQFADVRLQEAQRLFALGRNQQAVAVLAQYDAAVGRFNDSVASTALDTAAVDELSRYVEDRRLHADASLNALAGSLKAHGDEQTAAMVSQAQTNVDEAFNGTKTSLQAHSNGGEAQGRGEGQAHQPKGAGDQH